ncbi:hypothetical protein FOXYSP1_13244 [Fusarium oxysporum f. sp. phaseoli]
MDIMNLHEAPRLRLARPGETHLTFHFIRRQNVDAVAPLFVVIEQCYGAENVIAIDHVDRNMIELHVFAAGDDWTAHRLTIRDILEDNEISRFCQLLYMSACCCLEDEWRGKP